MDEKKCLVRGAGKSQYINVKGRTVKAGIIGFGYMGNYHLRKIRQIDGFEVTAAYDIDPDRRADARGAGLVAYESLEDFLADKELTLAIVCTPNNVHAELAIACLQAGKHVMCEKPATMNTEELERVLEVAHKCGRIFTAHQNRRWDVDYLVVREVLTSGAIGNPTTLISRVYGQRGVCFGWRADPAAGGGMLYDWGVHLIDQLLQLFPNQRVESIYARLQSILTPAVDDSFELQMIFESGMCAKVQVGTFSLENLPRWFIYGDRGTLRLDDFTGTKGDMARIRKEVTGFDSVFGKNLGPSRTMAPLRPEYIESLPLPQVFKDELAYHYNLLHVCQGLEKPLITEQELRRSMKVIDLAFESSRTNSVMKVSF